MIRPFPSLHKSKVDLYIPLVFVASCYYHVLFTAPRPVFSQLLLNNAVVDRLQTLATLRLLLWIFRIILDPFTRRSRSPFSLRQRD